MDAQTLREVMGSTLPDGGYTRLIDGYNAAMRAAHVTTVERAAMFAAQLGHESVGLKYMREIASGAEYEGRRDLGNIYPGDGVRYAGRGPIQLTGRNNYRAFTRWAQANGHTTIDFEAEPERLEEPHWGFLAASYYWVAARPQINSLCDRRDLEGVTRAINGGLNGLSDRRARYQRALTYGARLLPGESKPPMEKVLDYSRDLVAQETFYYCGPASSQTIIRSATGNVVSENDLARQLGTTRNGTDWIGLFPAVLNRHLPGAEYRAVEMPNDPPTGEQRERLWRDITASINAGYGVVANIVAPPSNYPRAVAPSDVHPRYTGGTVYHYIALMGYSDGGGRRVWVADSGFYPYGYWIGFDQLATLIPPKGYAFSTAPARGGSTIITQEDDDMALFGPDQVGALNEAKLDSRAAVQKLDEVLTALAEIDRRVHLVEDQLIGPEQSSWPVEQRNPNGGRGWPQLGVNEHGQWLTIVDFLRTLGRKVGK